MASEFRRVAVIGSGSWGTAAAGLVARNSDEVCVWARTVAVADSICERHVNPKHLSDYVLPENVVATDSLEGAAAGADCIVVAVPSAFVRGVMHDLAPHVDQSCPVVVLTKGVEGGSHKLMTDVVADELGNPSRVAALSGPNHAEEIWQGMVSAAVVAAGDAELALRLQSLFHSKTFRTYCSSDLTGVEVCAAAKNVVAIACGACAGNGMGDNALAVVMTRGLAEISRIVAAVGGDPMTCMGLAGMGDLVATCTSPHSRNRSFGELLSRGVTLAEYEERSGMVVEGARAAQSIWELASELSIETPLTNAVHAVLYENIGATEAFDLLLERSPRQEFYGLR